MATVKVKISDSTDTISSEIAASSTAVKAAMDKANSCLPLSGGTMTGNLSLLDAYSGRTTGSLTIGIGST